MSRRADRSGGSGGRRSGWLLILGLAAAWDVLARAGILDSVTLPPFGDVLLTLTRSIADGELPRQALASLRRMFAGYLLAAAGGGALGVSMGYFNGLHRWLEPLTEMLRPIPAPAYVPVAILFFGLGDGMKVFVIAFGCFFPVLLSVHGGVRGLDPVLLDTARTLGLSSWQTLRKVVLPAVLPNLLTGMRISLGIALILVVISEMIASSDGLGYHVLSAQRSFRVREMYSGVVALGLLGYGLNAAFTAVEKRLLHWHIDSRAQS